MAKNRGNKLGRRIKRTGRKINRLNKRIGGLKPNEDERRARLVAKRDAIKKRRGKLISTRDNRMLANPTAVLSGRRGMRAARQLERLTSLPAIRAKKNEIGQIQRETDRDVGKLGAMGQRLDKQVGDLRGHMERYGQEAYAQSEKSGQELRDRLAGTAQQATDRTNQLQSSVLGGQISAFQNQSINPASSGSAGLMAQFAQAGQNATAANSQANQQLGALMSAANVANTQAATTAAGNTLSNQAIEMQRNIVTRQADRQNTGSEALRTARSELGTLKGLRGAELVNQLMKIRGTEREFISQKEQLANERFAARAAAAKDRADAANDAYKNETGRMEARRSGRGGGSSGGSDEFDDRRLGRGEYRQFAAAADAVRDGGGVKNWNKFLDAVAKSEGVNWSPIERRKFKRRYRKQLRKGRR